MPAYLLGVARKSSAMPLAQRSTMLGSLGMAGQQAMAAQQPAWILGYRATSIPALAHSRSVAGSCRRRGWRRPTTCGTRGADGLTPSHSLQLSGPGVAWPQWRNLPRLFMAGSEQPHEVFFFDWQRYLGDISAARRFLPPSPNRLLCCQNPIAVVTFNVHLGERSAMTASSVNRLF
jgi:hypothetical protein